MIKIKERSKSDNALWSYLHEEASDQGFTDVDIIFTTIEFSAGTFQIKSVHDASQLLPYVVC